MWVGGKVSVKRGKGDFLGEEERSKPLAPFRGAV